MKLEDIKKLANMARIDMDEVELSLMAKDFDSILSYVDQIKEFTGDSEKEQSDDSSEGRVIFNVMREDIVTNKPGEYSDDILAEMHETKDGYLKVKQIL